MKRFLLSTVAIVGFSMLTYGQAPVANSQTVTIVEDSNWEPILLTGSDPNGDPITFTVTTFPGHGTLTGTAPNVSYLPAMNYNGTDFFQFVTNDGTQNSAPATVTIVVLPMNDAPVANNDNGPALTEDGPNGTVNILTNDTDIDGIPAPPVNGGGDYFVDLDVSDWAIQTTFANAQGIWSLDNATGIVTFDPAIDYNGTAVISYRLSDSFGGSGFGNISFVVAPVNDPPVANCNNLTGYLNASGNFNIIPPMMNNGSTDDNGIVSMSINPTGLSCSNIGANNVILTVFDAEGLSSSCIGVVNILDSIRPNITTCPGAQTIVAGAGCVAIVPDYSSLVAGTDNCGITSITQISPSPGTSVSLGSTVAVTVRVSDASGNSRDCNFTLTVVGPEMNVSGNSISITDGDVTPTVTDFTDFGNVLVCSGTTVRTFMLQNTGNAALWLGGSSSITITGANAGDFMVIGFPPTSIAAGGGGGFQIQFNPSGSGLRTATVNIANDDCDENPYTFAISGFGDDPEINVKGNGVSIADGDVTPTTADHTDFGSVLECTGNIIRTFTVENTGTSTLSVGTVTITGVNASDFSLFTQSVASLAPGGSGTFQIRFDPTAVGLRSAIIHVSSDDCDEASYDFTVQGTGNADIVNPIATCQNITLQLNASGSASVTPAMLNNGSSDNCGIASMSVSQNTFSCANVGPNNVTLTVTDNSGNTGSCTAVVTVADTVRPIAVAQNITVTLSGGVATVSAASINNGSSDACGIASMTVSPNTFTCSNLGPNTVTLTVTDVNGNTSVATAVVTVLSNLTATASGISNVSCFGGINGQATITPSGGAGPFAYVWTPTGGTNATATGLSAGTYTCTVTDAGGCTTSQTVSITQPATALLVSTASQTNVSCNGGSDGAATVAATGGECCYTYNWNGNPTGDGTPSVTGLTAGTYFCQVTDGAGCSYTQVVNILQPTQVVAASSSGSILCNGGNTTVTVTGSGGISPYTGEGTFTVTAGTYSYTITDANGCTTTTSITVTEPSVLSASSSATSIACNGGNATVTVIGNGGTSPYTGEGTFAVTAGTYSYTVTDANGCTATTSITVTEPTVMSAASSATNILCNGGSATITVTGSGGTSPYTGEGTFTVTAGTYLYTVTDVNGCTAITSITVTEPTAISSTVTTVNVSCNGGSDGSIDLTVAGGTFPYTYDWNSGAYTTEDLAGLPAGTYIGVLTDANGCTDGGTIVIAEPAVLVAALSSATNPTTCSGTDGAIDITISGGTNGYTFLWSNAATTEDLSGIAAGVYSCVVTDANGCTASAGATLNNPNAPAVTVSLPLDTMCFDDGAITLTGENPIGGTFSGLGVSGGSFTPSVAGIGTHPITYAYMDVNGCTGSAVDSINVDACMDITPVETHVFNVYPNPNNGAFTLQHNSTHVVSVLIYDAQGKLVYTDRVQPGEAKQMNIDAAGMYMITLVTHDGQKSSERVSVVK